MEKRIAEFGLLTTLVFAIVVLVPSASAASSVDFSWDPLEPFAGQEVTFTAIVNGISESDIISFNWNFGDGFNASGQTVTHQFAKGNNTVTLTLKRKANAEDSETFAIWANSTIDALAISASGMIINGSLHSNNDVDIHGTDHIINGKIEYLTTYAAPETIPHEKVASEDFPIAYDISEYKPGGSKASDAQEKGKYHIITEPTDIGSNEVLDGLYYATATAGTVKLRGNNISGIFTLVAEGAIHVTGSYDNFTSYVDDLLFFSNTSDFQISKSNSQFLGNIYVPNGQIQISGADNGVVGSLYADSIKLATSGSGMNSITAIAKNNINNQLNAKPGIEINVERGYIGEIVPVELKFAVTKNVSAMLAVDGWEIWEKGPIFSMENVSWIPMSSGRHVITAYLYSLNGMEYDNSSVSIPIYIKKVTQG